ncbi:IclR family transcriptional regulator [Microbacterium kribbense]|uniref:IclR family transcriptional regulator n=1 Tax=Microbacterium kribbense TaxID=433645 RepID=A0ABP7GZ17_9MICO
MTRASTSAELTHTNEPRKPEARTVRSVVHAVTLLKELSRLAVPTSLGDLAASVGLSKPATFNLLKTLEVEGLIAKDDDARYRLTWGMYELGSAVLRSTDLSRVSRIHLDRLADQTGEAVLLGILDEQTVLYIDRGQAAETFAMVANVGRRSPLHTNASGKVLLAGQPDTALDAFLASASLDRMTPYTITDPARLREEVDTVRDRGYALCAQEQEEGLSSVSVPVRGHSGRVIAALTVAAPSQRIDVRSIPDLRDRLLAEATAISVQLGAGVAATSGA